MCEICSVVIRIIDVQLSILELEYNNIRIIDVQLSILELEYNNIEKL